MKPKKVLSKTISFKGVSNGKKRYNFKTGSFIKSPKIHSKFGYSKKSHYFSKFLGQKKEKGFK